jgi:hypothetical protein
LTHKLSPQHTASYHCPSAQEMVPSGRFPTLGCHGGQWAWWLGLLELGRRSAQRGVAVPGPSHFSSLHPAWPHPASSMTWQSEGPPALHLRAALGGGSSLCLLRQLVLPPPGGPGTWQLWHLHFLLGAHTDQACVCVCVGGGGCGESCSEGLLS